MIDWTAFAHGQVHSKLWLCEKLEPLLPPRPDCRVLILGSWYGVLNHMMLTRNHNRYDLITGIDKDKEAIEIAEKLLSPWTIGEDNKSKIVLRDLDDPDSIHASTVDYPTVIINCSCEHMSSEWYRQTKNHQLLCLQSSNRSTDDPSWNVTNPNRSMAEFKAKFPMSQILFEGERVFDYGHLSYSRYMLIGKL